MRRGGEDWLSALHVADTLFLHSHHVFASPFNILHVLPVILLFFVVLNDFIAGFLRGGILGLCKLDQGIDHDAENETYASE